VGVAAPVTVRRTAVINSRLCHHRGRRHHCGDSEAVFGREPGAERDGQNATRPLGAPQGGNRMATGVSGDG
jgi:hypothetical protein